jgi:hypothetical protein
VRAALLTLLLLLALPAAPAGAAGTLAAHGMVYLDSPPSFKEAMFAQAADLGASAIRVDVDVSEIVRPDGSRWWDGLDEDIALARKYRLEVMGVLIGTPSGLAKCDASVPAFFRFRCVASDERRYAAYVGEIVRRARGAIDDWQVLSEPDNPLMFHGTNAQYARRLVLCSAAIRRANPAARVVLADLASTGRREYMAALLKRRGVVASFDVAALSLRGSVRTVVAAVPKWRTRLRARGFRGPIWVSEHGYPADPAYQWDPAYRGGEAQQAAYLAASLPALLHGGAARVFVSLRDSRGGPWASEGLLTGGVLDPPQPDPVVVRRPSALVFQRLARPLRGDTTIGRGRCAIAAKGFRAGPVPLSVLAGGRTFWPARPVVASAAGEIRARLAKKPRMTVFAGTRIVTCAPSRRSARRPARTRT